MRGNLRGKESLKAVQEERHWRARRQGDLFLKINRHTKKSDAHGNDGQSLHEEKSIVGRKKRGNLRGIIREDPLRREHS